MQRAFQLAYARPARDEELRLAVAFLSAQDTEAAQNRLTRWERLAQVLIGSNEFMYID